MRRTGGDSGIALVVVMLLAAVALAISGGLMYMLARSGYLSGMQKQYKTALEAGVGGTDVAFQVIASGGTLSASAIGLTYDPANVATKLQNRTADWGGLDSTMTINALDNATYDMTVDLGNYRVYSKIVDTVPGNSAANLGLQNKGVASGGGGEIVVMSTPYLYTIEVLAQRRSNPSERAKLSVLYEY
ncbi:MAG: hypothetical protein ACM3NF_08575 [Gemmatimonadota bacterium]